MSRTRLAGRNLPAESWPGRGQEGERDRTERVERGREQTYIQPHQIKYRKYMYKSYRNGKIALKNNNNIEIKHRQQQLRQALATHPGPTRRSPRSTKVRQRETWSETQRERETHSLTYSLTHCRTQISL